MMTPDERLVYMANQIARNFAANGADEAAEATAGHIEAFWDPRMKDKLFAMGVGGLEPIAAAALALLRRRVKSEGCDAG